MRIIILAVLLGVAAIVTVVTNANAQSARVRALVELTLNGQALGTTELLREGAAWYASETDVAEWRLRATQTRTIAFGGRNWKLLNDLPGARFEFDEAEQRLHIEIAVSAFAGSRLDAMAGVQGVTPELSQARGGFINYSLFASQSATQSTSETSNSRSLNGFFDGALFAPGGTLTASVAGLNLTGAAPGRGNHFVRIESQWRRDYPQDATSLVVGDTLSGGGLVGRSTRFAGVQWRSDFTLRPGFVKFERPSLAGEALTPSVVELFVNGQLRGRSEVAPGPFEIPPIPFVTGRGEATVVVRDIFGRQQVITQPFYATSTLLRAGVTEHSLEAGAARRAFGVESGRYGTAFASGLMRHGWTPGLTTEVKLEASRHQAMAGGAVTALLPLSVLATAGGAVSDGERGSGALSLFNLDAGIPQRLNFNFNLLRTHRDFRQPAIESAAAFARYQSNATLSAPLGIFGTLAFSAITLNTGTQPTRINSASYSVTLARRVALVLNATRSVTTEKSKSVFMLLSMPFGERGGVTVHQTRSGASESMIATLQSSAPLDGGYGYRYAANRNNAVDRHDAGVSARFAALEASFDASVDRNTTHYRTDVRGALVHLDGGWHASRTVQDGFALVRAPGLADAPVRVNNVPVGRTGKDGDFVATSIFAYNSTRIAIGTDDLPLEITLEPNEHKVATGFRSGALAQFRVVRDEGILLLVRLPDGSPLATGATIRVDGGDKSRAEEALVGYDGKAFFTKLGLPARLVAEYEQLVDKKPVIKRCAFAVAEMPAEPRAQAAMRGQSVTCVPQ